ncbi:LysR substrate-binding domain-containing protein [Roseomonas sp. OT10]|uniref:LysR substrate-binding domain-containing protein n=1 Tax=Roseomonas cutis TaxID=2897332 RepID=UPI001E4817FE|nr:LysR substrate-binding domain-containing protein [Roseomonas sp. OT10]UFN49030.1 LysR substrate-binding domain-containing protein [Roseomonas sp. OT10]
MQALPPGLDPDLLRSFVLVAEGGSVTRAAQSVGRTQSAVSMQMRRLEEVLGQPLLVRGARGLSPTTHGEWLLDRARRMLEMNDEIISGFRTPELVGRVRLGSPDDYALIWLPEILARFAQAHPAVEIEVVCLPSTALLHAYDEGELDITIFSLGNERPGTQAERLWRGPLRWIGAVEHPVHLRRPLPVALCSGPCPWSRAAEEALVRSGLPWRVAYSSASQTGTHAIALAGLAVTMGLSGSLPPGLRVLGEEDGLPRLPDFQIALRVRPNVPLAARLGRHITEGFRAEMETTAAVA